MTINIKDMPGYYGAYCDDEAPGAYPNGTRIMKAKSDPGDSTPIGTMGTVLGSVFTPKIGYAYFIEWDDKPRIAVFTVASKLAGI